jgi:hypothetical protein
MNPYYELLPDYKISPFSNYNLLLNRKLPYSNIIDDYFNSRFKEREYTYTQNGREAINLALKSYNLKPDDIVTIFTTSGNYYISGCVTKEIEKFCKWSMKIEEKTKVLFINHEFGYPYDGLVKLKSLNIPIIEDCAHSFFSKDVNNTIGTLGDFVIYSFPKMFPIQIGGLLVCKSSSLAMKEKSVIGIETLQYIKNVLSNYIKVKDEIIFKRLYNYNLLREKFGTYGYEERFHSKVGIVPGVFMFQIIDTTVDCASLKNHFYNHGIQCSVFYGERAFFIPCHQNLNEEDIEYFYEVFLNYIKKTQL